MLKEMESKTTDILQTHFPISKSETLEQQPAGLEVQCKLVEELLNQNLLAEQ